MSKALTLRSNVLASQLDYWLVDGSSSMQSKWWEMLAGMDAYQKVLASENIHSHGIAATFDTQDLQCIQRDSIISDWKPFFEDPLGAYFTMTPLYDGINIMGRNLRDLDPKNATIVIVTDGDENASKHTNSTQARAILDWCRAKGWQIIFLGADFENSSQAKLLGASDRNSIGVRSMKLLEAVEELGKKRVRNARTGADITFSDEEKQKFGGFLSHG